MGLVRVSRLSQPRGDAAIYLESNKKPDVLPGILLGALERHSYEHLLAWLDYLRLAFEGSKTDE